MPYYIAFDIGHKPRGRINENLIDLRDFLTAHDFNCYEFLEGVITREALKPYDILVFVCPDFAKISHQEIMEIESWVKEDGGGLLILSHAGGDKGRGSNLSELSEQFGMTFENDQVLDETMNIGMENMPVIQGINFTPPHPITDGLNEFCYRAGCSLSIMGNAFSIASSNETSEPFSCPLICVSEQENGRVCAIGSYEMFRDKIGGGFKHTEHENLAKNVFSWLISEYRTELRSGETVPAPAAGQDTGMPPIAGADSDAVSEEGGSVNIDFSLKISTKSELMELLKIFLNQINTIRDTIENLINKAEASEDEIISLKEAQIAQPQVAIPSVEVPGTDDVASAPSEDDGVFILHELKQPPLSALPPKPVELLTKAPEAPPLSADDFKDLISGEPEAETATEADKKPKAKKKPAQKAKPKVDKDGLKAELEGLESKLNSVQNLISFIKKKHDSGKMTEKAFDKQYKKLQKDIEKTESRMEEIKKILES